MSCTRPNRLINMVLLVVLLRSFDRSHDRVKHQPLVVYFRNPYLQRAIAMAIIGNFFTISCAVRERQ